MIKLLSHSHRICLFLLIQLCACIQLSYAQMSATDTIKAQPLGTHSPKKAASFSAMLPGLGQAYNKKYWKIPVIYVGFGALAYSINFNQQRFVKYRNAYVSRIDDDPTTVDDFVNIYSDENLNTLQRYYHRYRDLSVIGVAAVYLLNIIDASVDAHFFTFNISDDLSMQIRPSFINTAYRNAYVSGISVVIKL